MAEPTPAPMPGIHHITALCGDPQRKLDFYTGLPELRLPTAGARPAPRL